MVWEGEQVFVSHSYILNNAVADLKRMVGAQAFLQEREGMFRGAQDPDGEIGTLEWKYS